MKNEPEIIRQLRKEEELGILRTQMTNNENYEVPQEIFEKDNDYPTKKEPAPETKDFLTSERKYKYIFETAIDPIIIFDTNGVFVKVNNQVTNILGYKKEYLIGKTFGELDILTAESKKIVLENFVKRMKGENIPPYEIEILTKTKEIIHAEINAAPIFEDGKIVGDLVILRDLTERKKREKAEEELSKSERRFRDIFDATSDFLLYMEKDIILDINESAMKLSGLKKNEVIGKNFSIFKNMFSTADYNFHIKNIENASKGFGIRDYGTELVSCENKRYEFLFSVECISDEEELKGILLRGRDVTQRQKAWDQLVKLEEKYRVLAETSADGVITIDNLGRLTYVNPSFEKMCARRKSQILATMFRDYLSDDSVYFFQQIFVDSRKNNEKIENVELELVHANGDTIPIEVNIAPFKKEDDFAGIVCTIRDITERRKVEDELKKSERLKTEFMNIAAHELKSPVTPIKGYLDLIISDNETSDRVKGWAKISLRNAERLLRLVNDILDVSRLDTDTMRFEMEKLDSVEILDEIAEDMKATVEGKGLKFIVDIPRDLPNIMGDRHRLSQVLKNLLVNAIKFTDNGSISIIAEKKDDNILIQVKDTGVGISKDEEKKVFNKFYQAYTGDDRKNEGTGLGLFICKEIIQKHKGDIWVKSEIRKGSTFYIKIPYIHKMVIDVKNKK
jgi:PAS domain S-box-containing protein